MKMCVVVLRIDVNCCYLETRSSLVQVGGEESDTFGG